VNSNHNSASALSDSQVFSFLFPISGTGTENKI